MKLSQLVESGLTPEQRHQLHLQVSAQRTPREQEIIQKVKRYLINGNSSLKAPLANGTLSMDEIIDKMKNRRCIGTPTQDIGHAQVKNIIGNAIRDIFPDQPTGAQAGVNEARRAFGLKPVRTASKPPRHPG